MAGQKKQLSTPFSTGGSGEGFENRVQAAFVVLMLTGGAAPCLPPWPIVKLELQGRYAGFNTDDLIVYVRDPETGTKAKLLVQIKHSVSITEGNTTFGEVIQAAWQDFNNPKIFNPEIDALALITGPLTATEINDTRILLEWVRHSADPAEFLTKVNKPDFSSDTKRSKLKAFQKWLTEANNGVNVSDEQLWRFLRSFHLLGYDLDTASGSTLSLLMALIAQNTSGDARSLWSRIVETVQLADQNAATLTLGNIPQDIREAFRPKQNRRWAHDIEKLREHGDYILNGIRSSIGGVHVPRPFYFEQLLDMAEKAQFVFVTGARGCGKSALVREFADYMSDRAPVFCLRTEDLDKAHLDNVFSAIGLSSSLSELEVEFALMPNKYLLLESFEKLLELANTSAFTDLLHFVQKHSGWTIIASGRDYAYQQICFNFLQPFGIDYSSLIVEDFNDSEVQYLCEKLQSLDHLRMNPQIGVLLRNPSFADLAYRVAQKGTRFLSNDGEAEFIDAVWREVISNERDRREGMPLRRKNVLIDVAVKRAKQMVYSVPVSEFDSAALLKLEEDGLLRRDPSGGFASLAHDVLEDWALERYIDDAYKKHFDKPLVFFETIGHEPAINRAFRLWLHRKLRYGDNMTSLILAILNDLQIKQCWRDETISAILLGENPYEFLNLLRGRLFENNGELLKRFCFILRVACKVPDEDLLRLLRAEREDTPGVLSVLPLKPYGVGWDAMIRFLHASKDRISGGLLPHVTAVLSDWASCIHIDRDMPSVAREAGLLALHLLNYLKDTYRVEQDRKKLLSVIIRVAPAIIDELNKTLEVDVFGIDGGKSRRAYIDDLCSVALNSWETAFLCKHAPDIVIRLAMKEWIVNGSDTDRHPFRSRFLDIGEYFGIHDHMPGGGFFPPSGVKGPFWQLLRFHPQKGLDFIIELLNIAAQKYAYSGLDLPRVGSEAAAQPIPQIEVQLNDGTAIKQYCSGRLWGAYRGLTVVPHVLQCALMALENWLIAMAEEPGSAERIRSIFDYILRNSNSVMPTAVLASVATGFPSKIGDAAFPLLRTPAFYDLDLERAINEMGPYEIDWHKTGLRLDPLADFYSKERRKAALRPWRKKHLEDLIVRLQFSDLRNQALSILDKLRSEVPNNEKWRFRFHRIDSRGWEPHLDAAGQTITFMPRNLEQDLQKTQQETQEKMELLNRFSAIDLWARKVIEGEPLDREYYKSWVEALSEAKELFRLLKIGAVNELTPMHHGGIVRAAAVILRDHSSEMSGEDLSWCVEVVVQAILSDADSEDMISIADKTDLNGAAVAASVLPIILGFATDESKRFLVREIIATALTHSNANVRAQAANGVREYLWKIDANFAQECIIGSLEYARLEKESMERINRVGRKSRKAWVDRFRKQLSQGRFKKVETSQISFESHSSWHLLAPCLMVPIGSTDQYYLELMSRMLELCLEAESLERFKQGKSLPIDHELPWNFARLLADHLLALPEQSMHAFIEQLRDRCDIAPEFTRWLMICIASAAERIGRYECYWEIWKQLSEKVQKIAIAIVQENPGNYRYDDRTKLIRAMLHVDTPWQKVEPENRFMALGKDVILEFVSNAGLNPTVFEAMASLMFHFPALFLESGLRFLSKHQHDAGGVYLLSGVNTTFYLTRAIQRFLFVKNTGALPPDLYQSCLILLDAMIETGSAEAYYLREHLIKSRRIAPSRYSI